MFCQDNEEEIIVDFFNNKKNGFVIEIGAVDGLINSNSRFLISNLNWSGLLVEPNPFSYNLLKNLYRDNANIKLQNIAIFNKEDDNIEFHIYGEELIDSQGSTISTIFKERATMQTGDKYNKTIFVKSKTLKNLFIENNILSRFDFLSVDCEGVDYEVLESNDWNMFRPNLICVENSLNVDKVESLLKNNDYIVFKTTKGRGNTFYKDNRCY